MEENGYFTESSFLGLKDVLIEVGRMDLVQRIEVFLRFQGNLLQNVYNSLLLIFKSIKILLF